MNDTIRLNAKYAISEAVVAREIEGEMVIVPLTSDVGDLEDEIYTLNETGKVIWDHLDGQTRLKDVIAKLSEVYEAGVQEIETDVCGLMTEFWSRNFLVEISD